jgi:hypothetical protein
MNAHEPMMQFLDTFVAIVRDVGFHVGWKQLHTLLSIMFNSFSRWVDIVFIKDNIYTLIDIVIIDLTWNEFISPSSQLKDLLLSMQFRLKKRIIVMNTQLINSSL